MTVLVCKTGLKINQARVEEQVSRPALLPRQTCGSSSLAILGWVGNASWACWRWHFPWAVADHTCLSQLQAPAPRLAKYHQLQTHSLTQEMEVEDAINRGFCFCCLWFCFGGHTHQHSRLLTTVAVLQKLCGVRSENQSMCS